MTCPSSRTLSSRDAAGSKEDLHGRRPPDGHGARARARGVWPAAVAAMAGLVWMMPGCAWFGGRETARSGTPVVADPSVAERWVRSAEGAYASGDRERALRELARAIEINPQLTTAHMAMGDIYRTERNYESAERSYRRAAELEPTNFDAQYYHGLMLHLLERVSEAIGAYLRALSVRPEDFQANLNIATAYFQLGEYEQSLPFAQRATRLRPRDGAARFNLGAVYAGLDRHADAVVEYQQATELMDLTPRLLLNLAESLGRLGRWTEMRNTLDQLIKTSPSPAAWERLGFALFRLERYDEAKAAFESSLRMDPDYFPALNGLGICELNNYIWSDKTDLAAKDRALGLLRRSLRLNRDQPRIEELITRYR
jgi:tetratricopeptide (TPR) repeat protein